MRSFACTSALLCAVSAVAQMASISDVHFTEVLPQPGGRWIVEFEQVGNSARGLEGRQAHELVYASLTQQGISWQTHMEYNAPGIFSGASISLDNPADANLVEKTQGVVSMKQVTQLELAAPVSPMAVNAAEITSADTQSTHVMTGVDKLHAEGITGKGVKIGIIDTGIDYTHPALGGGFGKGFKVIGGYDFVGNAYNGTNAAVADSNPLDQCNGHGTHVAGIIAAAPGNSVGISGVAYDSKLYAYRIFGCSGSTSDDIVVAALTRASNDGNDIITLSLGAANGWTESFSAVIASRIAARGVPVTAAAGNDGSSGAWYTSKPGDGTGPISVGSVENTQISLSKATVTVNGQPQNSIIYYSSVPLVVTKTLPLVTTSNDTTIADDACKPLPSTVDLSNRLVLIRRGTCAFTDKIQNVAARGAKYVLFYDNGSGFMAITVGNFTASLIQAADGESLVKQYATGMNIQISFPQTGASANYPSPVGGLMSTFSSYGPTNNLYFKPALSAPGGNILSTLPVSMGKYATWSGTSMATPFVAGSLALLQQAKGKKTATAIQNLFETTAQTVPLSNNNNNTLQTVAQQGAGLIQVHNAIRYGTVVTPGQLVFNDTSHFKGTHRITVTNKGQQRQSYTIKHIPAGTAQTVGKLSIWPNVGPVPLTTQYATANLPSNFQLAPSQSKTLTLQFTPPGGVDTTKFPVYSGFIQIASQSETLHVSYLGVAANLLNKQVLDTTSDYFKATSPFIVQPDGTAQVNARTYTFTGNNYPKLAFRLLFGSPLLRYDLVNTSGKVVGSLGTTKYISRNNENPNTNGAYTASFKKAVFSDGSRIQKGTYRIMLRALRVTGDPKNSAHYDKWTSPPITVA